LFYLNNSYLSQPKDTAALAQGAQATKARAAETAATAPRAWYKALLVVAETDHL